MAHIVSCTISSSGSLKTCMITAYYRQLPCPLSNRRFLLTNDRDCHLVLIIFSRFFHIFFKGPPEFHPEYGRIQCILLPAASERSSQRKYHAGQTWSSYSHRWVTNRMLLSKEILLSTFRLFNNDLFGSKSCLYTWYAKYLKVLRFSFRFFVHFRARFKVLVMEHTYRPDSQKKLP